MDRAKGIALLAFFSIVTQSHCKELTERNVAHAHDSTEKLPVVDALVDTANDSTDELVDALVDKVFGRALKVHSRGESVNTLPKGIISRSSGVARRWDILRRGTQGAPESLLGRSRRQDLRVHSSGRGPAQRTNSVLRTAQIESLQEKPKNNLVFDATFVAILVVYLMQGSLTIGDLITSLFLRDELGLSPADMAAITGVLGLPWMIKPLYGLATDRLPVFGLRRKPYLVGAGFIGALSFLALGNSIHSSSEAFAAAIMYQVGICISDVVVDSLCVEKARDEAVQNSAGAADATLKDQIEKEVTMKLQSLCWWARSIGAVVAAAASGPLLTALGPRPVYSLAALFPLIVALSGLVSSEPPSSSAEMRTSLVASPSKQLAVKLRKVWKEIKKKEVYVPVALVVLFLATPSSGTALFYWFTKEMGLGPTQFANLQVVNAASTFGSVLLYRSYFANRRVSTTIAFASIMGSLLGLGQLLLVTHKNQVLGIPDDWLFYSDDVFLHALSQLAFMPTLTLAARICPPGQEGIFMGILMSAFSGAGILGKEVSAVLTTNLGITRENFAMLPMLIFICNIATLLPLPLVKFLDGDEPNELPKDQVPVEAETTFDPLNLGTADSKVEEATKARNSL